MPGSQLALRAPKTSTRSTLSPCVMLTIWPPSRKRPATSSIKLSKAEGPTAISPRPLEVVGAILRCLWWLWIGHIAPQANHLSHRLDRQIALLGLVDIANLR